MRVLCALCLLAALAVATAASPAMAWDDVPDGFYFDRYAHHKIYKWQNLIARMEADPNVDDGDKARAFPEAHAHINKWRSVVGLYRPLWPAPCCYSRRPIHIR